MEPNHKPTLNIVLVEPRIPQNTGNVAQEHWIKKYTSLGSPL